MSTEPMPNIPTKKDLVIPVASLALSVVFAWVADHFGMSMLGFLAGAMSLIQFCLGIAILVGHVYVIAKAQNEH